MSSKDEATATASFWVCMTVFILCAYKCNGVSLW